MKAAQRRSKKVKVEPVAPKLTAENYFSIECNMWFMGTSQFKTFLECEARGLAEAKGEYKREMTVSQLVGSYIDAYFGHELEKFKSEHSELFTIKTGELKSDYKLAETIIARIERDPLFLSMVSGKQQVIKTGLIAGVPFKIKIDSELSASQVKRIVNKYPAFSTLLFSEAALVDLKIMKDFKSIWVEGEGKVPFIRKWGYDIQGAIYQHVDGRNLPFFISAATKEKKEPNIEIFEIPQEEMDAQLMRVEELAPRFAAIKRGEIEPSRCGHCDYCKSTKVLTEPKDYRFYDVVVEDEY